MTDDSLIALEHVTARVRLPGGSHLVTVADACATFARGTSTAIVGRSGSGKTSVASIIGLLNADFSGVLRFDGRDVSDLSDAGRARLRCARIGFVFQNYSLIPHLNVWENVALPLRYAHRRPRAARRAAMRWLGEVGLRERATDPPSRLSGGEQQRVAIARAMANDPDLVICDEPTGALDSLTGERIADMLLEQVRSHGTTLVLVTHDMQLAMRCEHRLGMDRGRLQCLA